MNSGKSKKIYPKKCFYSNYICVKIWVKGDFWVIKIKVR